MQLIIESSQNSELVIKIFYWFPKIYLFRPKQRSNVVPNAAAPAGTHHGVALALAKLITACNTHTSGDDAV